MVASRDGLPRPDHGEAQGEGLIDQTAAVGASIVACGIKRRPKGGSGLALAVWLWLSGCGCVALAVWLWLSGLAGGSFTVSINKLQVASEPVAVPCQPVTSGPVVSGPILYPAISRKTPIAVDEICRDQHSVVAYQPRARNPDILP
ncbi:hypothetical protein E4U43_002451 [Claviceps pusilla]|uniref:Uncharacterized protein n=1 Tax=Claviceps pusilla TaxID=123648 RepID=A0A9P7NHY5_9HYPO|nr:hypothetical protein E4U43_002451 [Claviceps pusilla]